jgi:hypothetical protein
MTLSITTLCYYAVRRALFIVILNVIALSGVMFNVIMLSVTVLNIIMLSVVMLSVVVPSKYESLQNISKVSILSIFVKNTITPSY